MAEPLRILFVNRMAGMVRGGGETFDLEIARHLEQLGCVTTLLTGRALFGSAPTPLARERVDYLRTPCTTGLKWDRIPGAWRLRLADFYLFERAAAGWISARPGQFDIVQACELPYLVKFLKARAGSPRVSMRLTAPDYHDAVGGLAAADMVIASGHTMQKMKAGARPDCVDVPNGVDFDRFKPQASRFRTEHGIPAGDILFLLVARFQTVKNHPLLVRSFARVLKEIPEARLVLAGSGPFEDQVRKTVQDCGIVSRVLFLGEVAFENLPAVYAACDVMTITSDYESFCFAALEAMSSGLPVVTTRTDWIPRLLGDGAGGAVVPVRDEEALAAAMVKLGSDREARLRMGQRNRQTVLQQHGWASSAEQLLEAYRRVLAK